MFRAKRETRFEKLFFLFLILFQRKAKEDIKRANKAMNQAEEMIHQMDNAMKMEEECLQWRANMLRRQRYLLLQ